MKKILFLFPLISLFCFSCQKTEVQADPGIASPDAVEGHLVGIGFYGGSHPLGDATIKYGSTSSNTTLTVPTNAQVQVSALPVSGYVLDYWWKYDVQPPYDGAAPLPSRTKVYSGRETFTATITRETWFEPVFKPMPPIQVTVTIDLSDARGEVYFDYWDENNVHQDFYTRESASISIHVYPYSQILLTGYYKLNDEDPYAHYNYWAALNNNNIDMGMPYSVSNEFSFDHRITIAPEQNYNQVLTVVIDKLPFP